MKETTQISRFQQPKEFYQTLQEDPLASAATNEFILGLAHSLCNNPHLYGKEPFLATINEKSTVKLFNPNNNKLRDNIAAELIS